MVGPLIQKGVQAIGGFAGNAANNVVNKAAGDGNFAQTDDTGTKSNAAPESAEIGTNAVQALPGSTQKANIGIDQAAKIENELGTPAGGAVKGAGFDTAQASLDLIHQTKNDYQAAVQGAIKATTDAEQALNKAGEQAKIDPQQYLNNLGVGGKIMSSIGMVLSGIGSGVTGQPNLAMQMYQKNMDAAIAAQTQTFKNLMEASAQRQGLIKTAQDKQTIAATAYNAAVLSVATGANVAIQGLMTQIKSASAPHAAAQLQLHNDTLKSQSIDNHSNLFKSTIQSGDSRRTNLLGDITRPLIDKLTGKPGTPASKGITAPNRVMQPQVPDEVQKARDQLDSTDKDIQRYQEYQKNKESAIKKSMGQGTDSLVPPMSEDKQIESFLEKYGDKK